MTAADRPARRLTRRRVIPAVAGVATAVAAAFLPPTSPSPPTVDGQPVVAADAYRDAMDTYLASGGEEFAVSEESRDTIDP